jgi:hypothetical protein
MEKAKGAKLNTKAREFKPKKTPVMTSMPPPVQSESKYFKGVLPGQMGSNPPPSALPPGMGIKFENGELILPPTLPEGLRKMFLKAYEDGKFTELIRAEQEKEDMFALTPEEEELAESFLQEQKQMEMCPYYLEGKCKYGKKCENFHPSDIDEFASSVKFSGDKEWGIWMENVLAKDRQFGLLDGCEHAFWLECIRNWRATYIRKMSKEAMRACPLWRKLSYLVIPSSKYLPGGEAKSYLFEEYKEVLSEIPCRHFNFGKGECPFLNSCFYGHYTEDGKKYDYSIQARYFNEDGDIWVEKDSDRPTLANLMGL